MVTMQEKIDPRREQMEEAAGKEDYETALEHADYLDAALEAYETYAAQLAEKRDAYQARLQELEPRVAATKPPIPGQNRSAGRRAGGREPGSSQGQGRGRGRLRRGRDHHGRDRRHAGRLRRVGRAAGRAQGRLRGALRRHGTGSRDLPGRGERGKPKGPTGQDRHQEIDRRTGRRGAGLRNRAGRAGLSGGRPGRLPVGPGRTRGETTGVRKSAAKRSRHRSPKPRRRSPARWPRRRRIPWPTIWTAPRPRPKRATTPGPWQPSR